jgi:hypothetical protein
MMRLHLQINDISPVPSGYLFNIIAVIREYSHSVYSSFLIGTESYDDLPACRKSYLVEDDDCQHKTNFHKSL